MGDIVYITAQDPNEDMMMAGYRSKPAKKVIVIRDDGHYRDTKWQEECRNTIRKIMEIVSYVGSTIEEIVAPYNLSLIHISEPTRPY